MAPPSRRPGHSRKAQYGLFTGYVIAGIGALIGAALLAISLLEPAAFGGLRGVSIDVTSPVSRTTARAREGGQGLIETVRGYLRAGSQNAALKREVELARIRLAAAQSLKQENARLKGLLGLGNSDVEPVAITHMLGSSGSSARRFGYIGAGRDRGVTPGMPVRTARGVVGRVLETSFTTSRVLLLTDSQSVLPVRLADRDVIAFAQGRGDGRIDIRLINLGLNPLKRGDMFVTSGAGGFFQPGLPVALVEQLTDDGAIARIVSDPAAADFVAVEPLYQPVLTKAARTPVDQPLPGSQTGEEGGDAPSAE
ncbi:rod shape-determining protein MreC [Erythrobacter sp. 3-20A1M]|uniref:rod shape-determining protein MreC n=1 Tax=Erythrobacter sp. 3-20A1M TaxID=2653850 RepID=UPI001BFC3E3C|nr:rod shape-determining protein MreC [Erythrobacter sp. 3-20A1M]QWC55680.1 rod shape-determining protein MreC [Erythrobacter sp. 3-20A1M]